MARQKSSTAIYQLRAELCDIRPLIWRRLLVRAQATISDLHRVLQVAFGWYDEHLHRFDIFGQDYGEYREGGPIYSTDATKVGLSTPGLGPGDSFTYEYDFGDLWVHEIELEDVLADLGSNKTYPRCSAGMGVAPPEDCGGPLAAMQRYRRRVGRSSRLLDDDWDVDVDFDDDLDGESSDESIRNRDGFDRPRVNRALGLLVAGSYDRALDETQRARAWR